MPRVRTFFDQMPRSLAVRWVYLSTARRLFGEVTEVCECMYRSCRILVQWLVDVTVKLASRVGVRETESTYY